jgi:hypothetical protein
MINRYTSASIRSQFHQHFTREFFADILLPKSLKAKHQLCNSWRQNFVQKTSTKNVDEIDAR